MEDTPSSRNIGCRIYICFVAWIHLIPKLQGKCYYNKYSSILILTFKKMKNINTIITSLLIIGVVCGVGYFFINKNKNMEKIAKNGDVLVMNYTGSLQDGTVFDSNVDPRFNHVETFEFKLGAGMVIAGWDEGLVGMKVGEKKTLTIAPEKAYGENGVPGIIPPNSTLIFEVELVNIK